MVMVDIYFRKLEMNAPLHCIYYIVMPPLLLLLLPYLWVFRICAPMKKNKERRKYYNKALSTKQIVWKMKYNYFWDKFSRI